jgi:uncharacterized membrane protein
MTATRVFVFSNLLFDIPFWVLWFIGIVVAIVRWRHHPGASILSIFAFLLFYASTIIGGFSSFNTPFFVSPLGTPLTTLRLFEFGRVFISAVTAFVGWILLIIAFFAWRSNHKQQA